MLPDYSLFTERVRQSLAFAREEAARLHHEYVGTEHILLGLIREGKGVAATVLQELNLEPEKIRQRVEETVKTGKAAHATGLDLPYTSRAKQAIALAMSEARELGHNYVGTEHLLLGLLRQEKGIGAQVLVHLGANLDRARAAVRSRPGGSEPTGGAEDSPGPDYLYGSAQLYASETGGARFLLSVSAILAWLIGLMLIFVPLSFEAPMGIVLDDKTATIAQAQGAILLGLGAINWIARGETHGLALRAILYGNFVVQVVSFAVVARALVRGFIPMPGIGAALMHVVLGAAFFWQLRALRRSR
jgi:hypothetical protein